MDRSHHLCRCLLCFGHSRILSCPACRLDGRPNRLVSYRWADLSRSRLPFSLLTASRYRLPSDSSTLVLGLGGVAGTLRVLRANVLDVLQAEYVTAARAKGLPEKVVLFRHVLRNALNPLLSTIGYAFAGLLSGSLLVENVMNYPGLGRLVYEAFIREDQFVVLGSVVVGCSLLIIGNLLSDLALAWSDPRVRYGR